MFSTLMGMPEDPEASSTAGAAPEQYDGSEPRLRIQSTPSAADASEGDQAIRPRASSLGAKKMADKARRKSASLFGSLFGGDYDVEEEPGQKRKSSIFGYGRTNDRLDVASGSGRSSFSAMLGLDFQPTPEEVAAEAARQKKLEEEQAMLDGRLWEFLELDEDSQLIDVDNAKQIAAVLPPKHQMANWKLIYSTYRDGISMGTMYRKCYDYGGACVIFVKDDQKHVFGGFVTDPPHLTEEKHVGTGECFLFKLLPEFAVYKWTEKNRYFMMGDEHSFHMGSGEGRFGLWMEQTLTFGHSAPCETYDNDVISSTTDFKILGIEVWGFLN